jgi:predicted transcriptional regulator
MARPPSTRSAGAKLHRTETVSIRLDPRLNYLCELAARSQRRTKSSFIEAAIDEKIQSMSIANWRDSDIPDTLGDRADFLWHVREHERLISLGLVAPHLMTFEEQEIWATISEHGHFWRGRWVREGDVERWAWSRDDSSILRDRVGEWWDTIVKVAHGELDRSKLPQLEPRAATSESGPSVKARDLDDEVPF